MNNYMRGLTAVSSDESAILFFCALEGSSAQFALQCDQ